MHKSTISLHRIKMLILIMMSSIFFCGGARAFVVVLDAGHGGKDPGALGTYSKEKNITLNVVLKLGKLIENNCAGVKVRYTRTTDKFVELNERANIANNAKADLFISVHVNSTPSSNTAIGPETYSLSLERATANLEVVKRENSVIQYEENRLKYSTSSVENSIMNEIIQGNNMRTSALFAKSIQDEYINAGRPNRGVHQAGFLVLRQTAMPSILTELGFISTPSEEAYLNSEQGINELAMCIFKAFKKYVSPIIRGADSQMQDTDNSNISSDVTTSTNATNDNTTTITDTNSSTDNQPQPQANKATNNTQTTSSQSTAQTKAINPDVAKPNENAGKQSTPPYKEGDKGKYEFKVQICASNRNLRPDCEQFKGLKDVVSYAITVNGKQQYIHTYGSTQRYSEIVAIRNKVREKFADCFIVVFKNGERIMGNEASAAIKKQP